jgi:hypothetical protein
MADPHDLPNVPMTLQQAAGTLFPLWTYKQLRKQIKSLIAQGMPAVKEGRGYLLYPKHIEAWRIARYPADARRALRQGGYECSDAERMASRTETTTTTTP